MISICTNMQIVPIPLFYLYLSTIYQQAYQESRNHATGYPIMATRTIADKKAALLARKKAIPADDPRLSAKAAAKVKAEAKAEKKAKKERIAKAKATRAAKSAKKPKPKWVRMDLAGLPGLADFVKSCNVHGTNAITLEADTTYRPEYAEQATGLALLGHDYKDMAVFFGVPDTTIAYWVTSQPDFANAIRRGSTMADMQVVASFRKRAIGFTQETPGPVMVDREGNIQYGPDGKPMRQMIVQYFPPSESACSKWLSSRQRKVWGEVTKVESTVTATVQSATEARRNLAAIFAAPIDQPPEKG